MWRGEIKFTLFSRVFKPFVAKRYRTMKLSTVLHKIHKRHKWLLYIYFPLYMHIYIIYIYLYVYYIYHIYILYIKYIQKIYIKRTSCAQVHELLWGQWWIGNNGEGTLSVFLTRYIKYIHIFENNFDPLMRHNY